MKRITLLSTIFCIFFLALFYSKSVQAQSARGKCSSEVLAMNTTSDVVEKKASVRKPCPKKSKRINQSPTSSTEQDLFYYRDVDIDQVTDTYINTFPETSTQVEESLRSAQENENNKESLQKLSCKNQEKKDCTDKKEKEIRRVRPSATVKLVKY
jgi:lipoate-protein ligase A